MPHLTIFKSHPYLVMEGRQEIWFRDPMQDNALCHLTEDGEIYPVSELYTDRALTGLISFTEFTPLDITQLETLVAEETITPVMAEVLIRREHTPTLGQLIKRGWGHLTTLFFTGHGMSA